MALLAKLRRPTGAPAAATPTHDLSGQAIHANLLLAPDGVWAWFRMGAVPWVFRSTGERARVLDATTIRWSDLAGHRVHVRRTAHPVPYSVWAQRLDRATPHPIDVPDGAPTWGDYLVGAQERIADRGMQNHTAYIGVRVSTGKFQPHELSCIQTPTCGEREPERIRKAHAALTRVTSTVAKEGFDAAPVSSRVLGWLIHTSIGQGIPVSVSSLAGSGEDWLPQDMDSFTGPVHVSAAPLSKTLTVRALRDGVEHERQIAVLSVGRMNDRLDTESPAFEPWMGASDRLPFPVEWSATFDVVGPAVMTGKATFFRRRAESILEHYAEHDETPPPAVSRGIRDAVRIEDEIAEGDKEVAVRLVGPIRCAVSTPTEAETMEHVGTLIDSFAMHQRITLHHTYGQYALWREFIPGEPLVAAGFQRVMPAYYAATGLPNATTQLGDGEGMYLGSAGHRAVFFDPTYGPRHNKSGLLLIGGGLGSGKSATAGDIVEFSVRRGQQTVVFDPSGPLAALCDMPALAPYARHIELSGAEPGTLNPYWLIPVPLRAHYRTANEYHAAVREAEGERKDLMIDALSMLLPERLTGVVRAIESAVNKVGGEYAANPWRVVRALEEGNELARDLGAQLRDASTMKGARLIFPEDEDAPTVRAHTEHDAVLTVITMRGLTPPADNVRENWTRGERMAAPVLHLAARYATRAMYANQLPKTILCDETGIIATGASTFPAFLTRGARDSRKTNTCFGVLSQNPADLLAIAPQITNLIGAAIMGRIGDPDTAAAALTILGAPADHGYEKVLLGLETGAFVFRDWHGRTDRLDVDLGWRPDLLEALNTTPTQEVRTEEVETSWTDELVVTG